MTALRNIKYIVIHCTATPPNTTLESIQRYWREVKKWGDTPGYHYLIKADGEIITLLDESKNSYGVYAHNSECISLSYVGGVDSLGKPKDTRTSQQQATMFGKVKELQLKYPNAKVVGHRDFPDVHKACPSFDVKTWYALYQPHI